MGYKVLKNLVIFAVAVMAISACFQQEAGASKEESVYDRVMRTGTIRCGYFVEAPFTMRDEASGEMSGLAVELAEKIAQENNLKIEWAEQVSFGTIPQDLNNNRYDAVCASLFIMPRAGVMDYTMSYTSVPINGFVKKGNENFDKAINDIFWEDVSISGLDGEGATAAVIKRLPEARLDILPQLSSISEMLVMVETGKTDIAFVMPTVFEEYNKSNPDKLKLAKMNKPLYEYALAFGVARGQPEFKSMLNNTIYHIATSGELAMLFDKYDPKGHFKRPVLFQN